MLCTHLYACVHEAIYSITHYDITHSGFDQIEKSRMFSIILNAMRMAVTR